MGIQKVGTRVLCMVRPTKPMDGMPIFLQLACHQWDAICLRIGIDGIDGRQICLRATSALKIIELEQILIIMYII